MSRLEDLEAIRTLKAEYCHAVDEARTSAVVALFTDDAELDFGAMFGGPHVGRDAIEKFYQRVLSNGLKMMHAVSTPLIKVTGDNATGRWYLINTVDRPGDTQPLKITGRYEDEYRRVGGQWKICATRLTFLYNGMAGA